MGQEQTQDHRRTYVGVDENGAEVATRVFADDMEALAWFREVPADGVQQIVVTRSVDGGEPRRVGAVTRQRAG